MRKDGRTKWAEACWATRGAESAPIQREAPERSGTDANGTQHQVSTSVAALDLISRAPRL